MARLRMPTRQKWILALQLSVTLGLLVWIFHEPAFRTQIWTVLREGNQAWLILGVVLAGVEALMGTIRWRIFLQLLDIPISFARTAQLYLLGLFFNIFLVGMAGGDAVKVLILIAQGYRRSNVLLSILMDRLSGLIALVATSGFFLWFHYDWLMESPSVARMLKFIWVYLIVSSGLMVLSFWAVLSGFADRLPPKLPLRAHVQEFFDGYAIFVRQWRKAMPAYFISFGIMAAYFGIYYSSAHAFGVEISLSQMFAIMPAIDIITGMPISIGGVGVREYFFGVVLGELLQVPHPQAVMVSIAGYLCATSWGLVGAAVLPFFWGILKKARVEKGREEAAQIPDWKRAALAFKELPWLYYYGCGKMRSDPAYPAVRNALVGSSLPLHDLGCGAGFLTAYLRENGCEFAVHSSDLSASKIESARQVLASRYSNVSFDVGDAAHPPAGPLGNVVVLDLLHYFNDDRQRKAIQAWARLLAPGGQLLVRTTLRDSSWRYYVTLLEEAWVRGTGWIKGGDWNFPRRVSIEEMLRECGLEFEIKPLWGWTPFNSYWITAQKRTKNESPVSLETT